MLIVDAIIEKDLEVDAEISSSIEVVIFEGFDIILDNPTLIAGDLIVPFHFYPSPQAQVDSIELWVDGAMVETRAGNAEADFLASGLTGGKTIQIKAYKGTLLLEESVEMLLPFPIANDFMEVVFSDTDVVDMPSHASDPQGLSIELDNVGRPDYGTVEVDSTNLIKITKESPNDVIDTVVDYTIKNSIGNKDIGVLTIVWQKIFVGISSPVNSQIFEFYEDLIVSFGFTPTAQPYVDSIELIIDGSAVETRTGNSTADFTVVALSAGNHDIKIKALDSDGVMIIDSNVVSIEYLAKSIPHDHFYNFDETTGDLIDRKGTANGTLFGSIVRGEIGIKNQSYKFNGVNTYISVPGLNNEFTGSFSVGIWAKFTTNPTSYVRLIQTRGGGALGTVKGWQILTDGTDYQSAVIDDGAGNSIAFDDVLFQSGTSRFIFYAMTFDSTIGEAKLYIDGVMKSSKTNSNLIGVDFTSTGNFEIGRGSQNAQYINGNQDELHIYKGVWTPTEISNYVTNI